VNNPDPGFGSEEYTATKYVVGVFDLLGPSEKLEKWGELPKSDEERDDFEDAILQSYGEVLRVRTSFEYEVNELVQHLVNGWHPSLRESALDDWKRFRKVTLRSFSFSDTVVIYSRLITEDSIESALGVAAILAATGKIFLLSLNRKIPLRGGIEYGTGAELLKGEFYGSALARAYHIESKVSRYPRIVVGHFLQKYLDWVEAQAPNTNLEKFNIIVSEMCRRFLGTDYDGACIVDYLNERFQIYMGQAWRKNALDFIRSQIAYFQFAKHDNAKELLTRYVLLETYFGKHGVK
jgi:hypothetical protein